MRILGTLAAALALAACSGGMAEITGPFASTFAANGLEQEIRVVPAEEEVFGPDNKVFHLKSRIINRGDAPATVRVVTCWLDPRLHMRTRAPLVTRAIPGCIFTPDVFTLAPGEATSTVWWTGEIERAGRYTIQVRHALDPEFWGEVEIVAR